jgi:hypothetical protein
VQVNSTFPPLYLRGAAITAAYIDELLAAGLGDAEEVLINGGSAGGWRAGGCACSVA